ncbi:MAG: hypothetical protein F6J90_06405 [Moorea sp. SIOASIH]|nr:hypothetical protein [Moorena sp. SIOASIH]
MPIPQVRPVMARDCSPSRKAHLKTLKIIPLLSNVNILANRELWIRELQPFYTSECVTGLRQKTETKLRQKTETKN